jgi:hypothetical protein
VNVFNLYKTLVFNLVKLNLWDQEVQKYIESGDDFSWPNDSMFVSDPLFVRDIDSYTCNQHATANLLSSDYVNYYDLYAALDKYVHLNFR